MKKYKHEGLPKYLPLVCIAIIYTLARLSMETGRVIFAYLSVIPGLIVIVVCFNGMLNQKSRRKGRERLFYL